MSGCAVLLVGDVRDKLGELADQSVQCAVTSPPYWGLRDYGVAGQLGLEPTPELYVEHMVTVFREVCRVLRNDGTLWLNIGDSYAGSGKGAWDNKNGGQKKVYIPDSDSPQTKIPKVPSGMKSKDLVGIPWMLALALRADGWYLRSEIIWHKPNPMPESVIDRPTKAHETVFLLAKSAKYFYDAEAIAEPIASSSVDRYAQDVESQEGSHRANGGAKTNGTMKAVGGPRAKGNAKTFRGGGAYTGNRAFDNSTDVERESHGNAPNEKGTRNRRSVWAIPTQPFRGAHFATFPERLVEPCVLAGSAPGDLVLDPFAGSCTTAVVALRHNRNFVGVELSSTYAEIAHKRVADSGEGELLV